MVEYLAIVTSLVVSMAISKPQTGSSVTRGAPARYIVVVGKSESEVGQLAEPIFLETELLIVEVMVE